MLLIAEISQSLKCISGTLMRAVIRFGTAVIYALLSWSDTGNGTMITL
jgi:hypothetical protein